MNDSALAVYARVSVPWVTTAPSKSGRRSCSGRASRAPGLGLHLARVDVREQLELEVGQLVQLGHALFERAGRTRRA